MGEISSPLSENMLLKHGNLSQKQVDNRRLLRKVMKMAGFISAKKEWWHFNSCTLKAAKDRYKIIE